MAILNAVVIQSKEGKGGKHKVRISVAHNGETRYIVTDIILNSIKEFKNGAVTKRPDANILNAKIRGILERYQSTLDELGDVDGFSCPELVYQLKNTGYSKRRTLQSIYKEYMDRSTCKASTAGWYASTWNGICVYLDANMLISNINHGTILGFDKHLRERKLKPGTIRHYLVFLKALVTYAVRCGYVQFRIDPFFGYKYPEPEIRESWLTVEEVKAIRDLDTKRKAVQKCRDIFMLSYYLGGINITDLLDINFNEQVATLHYIRKKTEDRPKQNKFVEFLIPEEAKAIIAKRKGPDGRIAVSTTQRADKLRMFFDYNMPHLAELTGIKKLIYYSARKSFSQHAYNLGIETSVIDYILGHRVDKAGTSLYNYIRVTPEMATAAVRKVLDNLK